MSTGFFDIPPQRAAGIIPIWKCLSNTTARLSPREHQKYKASPTHYYAYHGTVYEASVTNQSNSIQNETQKAGNLRWRHAIQTRKICPPSCVPNRQGNPSPTRRHSIISRYGAGAPLRMTKTQLPAASMHESLRSLPSPIMAPLTLKRLGRGRECITLSSFDLFIFPSIYPFIYNPISLRLCLYIFFIYLLCMSLSIPTSFCIYISLCLFSLLPLKRMERGRECNNSHVAFAIYGWKGNLRWAKISPLAFSPQGRNTASEMSPS